MIKYAIKSHLVQTASTIHFHVAMAFTTSVFNSSLNESSNIDCWKLDHCGAHHRDFSVAPLFVNCVLNALLSITAITGNTLVIYSVWNSPALLHSPSNVLLFGLAVCDLGVGITVQPLYIIYHSFYLTNHLQAWLATMEVFNVISNLFCGVSFLTTTTVSIDRYLALHLHLRYCELITMRRTFQLLGSLWVIAGFVASSLLWKPTITFFAALLVIATCLFVTFVVYVKIFTIVRFHRKNILKQLGRAEKHSIPKQTKSALNMFYVCLIHTFCYLPYFVFLILRDGYRTTDFTILATEFAQTLIFLNSSLNPILYCWRLRDIREAVKQTTAKILCNNY